MKNSGSPRRPTLRHRHLVVLPLFFFFALFPLLSSYWHSYAASTIPRSGEVLVHEIGSLQLLTADGEFSSENTGLFLKSGSFLVFSDNRMAVRVGEDIFYGIAGAFHMTLHGEDVSVASISTPVLIKRQDSLFLVPVGLQFRLSHGVPLPGSPSDASLLSLPPVFVAEQLRMLSSALSRSPLEIAQRQESDPALFRSTVESFPVDAPDILLLFFHPQFRSRAWVSTSIPSLPSAAQSLPLLLLPLSDRLHDSLPLVAWQSWETLVRSAVSDDIRLASLGDVLSSVIVAVRDMVQTYPERARRYASFALSLLEGDGSSSSIAEEDRVFLQEIAEHPRSLYISNVPAGDSSSSVFSSVPFIPADERIAMVRDHLLRSGGMFTLQTRFDIVGASRVGILGLIVASSRGDRMFDVTYDVATKEVMDIVEGDDHFPYVVSIDQFFAWVKKG